MAIRPKGRQNARARAGNIGARRTGEGSLRCHGRAAAGDRQADASNARAESLPRALGHRPVAAHSHRRSQAPREPQRACWPSSPDPDPSVGWEPKQMSLHQPPSSAVHPRTRTPCACLKRAQQDAEARSAREAADPPRASHVKRIVAMRAMNQSVSRRRTAPPIRTRLQHEIAGSCRSWYNNGRTCTSTAPRMRCGARSGRRRNHQTIAGSPANSMRGRPGVGQQKVVASAFAPPGDRFGNREIRRAIEVTTERLNSSVACGATTT